MTIYGITIKKTSIQNPGWNNRYFVQASSITDALNIGEVIVTGEQMIHSDLVNFVNIHAWQPFVTPNVFGNRPLALLGDFDASNPIADWITFEATWEVENSYPAYKRYRFQADASALAGIGFASGFQTQITNFIDHMNDELAEILCTLQGEVLGTCSRNPQYEMLQPGKSWYNRKTDE